MTHGIKIPRSKHLNRHTSKNNRRLTAQENHIPKLMNYEFAPTTYDEQRRFKGIDYMLRGTN